MPRWGLETNSALAQAIGMYRANRYTEVDPFDDEPYAHHGFTKPVRGCTTARRARIGSPYSRST